MHRMAEITDIHLVADENGSGKPHDYDGVPEGVEIFEINGPFFFGAADKFRETIRTFKKKPKVLILRMSAVPAVDATAISALERLIELAGKDRTRIVIAGISKHVYQTLHRAGVVDLIGPENILPDVHLALARSIILIEESL